MAFRRSLDTQPQGLQACGCYGGPDVATPPLFLVTDGINGFLAGHVTHPPPHTGHQSSPVGPPHTADRPPMTAA